MRDELAWSLMKRFCILFVSPLKIQIRVVRPKPKDRLRLENHRLFICCPTTAVRLEDATARTMYR